MRYVRVLATAALLSAASVGAPVASEPLVRVQDQPKWVPVGCAPLGTTLHRLQTEYGQNIVLVGRLSSGFELFFLINFETGNWTSLTIHRDLACVNEYGTNMHFAYSYSDNLDCEVARRRLPPAQGE
jgi:hypothetical protein